MKLSDNERMIRDGKIIHLLLNGYSDTNISKLINTTKRTIDKVKKEYPSLLTSKLLNSTFKNLIESPGEFSKRRRKTNQSFEEILLLKKNSKITQEDVYREILTKIIKE